MKNELKLFERKYFRLVEEHGVAAIPYKHVIDKILNVCREMSSQVKVNTRIKFDIPNEILKDIDIVDDLSVIVTLYNLTGDYESKGTGLVKVTDLGRRTAKGTISKATIEITAYCYTDYNLGLTQLYDKSVLCSLYHELNHLCDIVNDRKKSNIMHRTIQSVNIADNEDDTITGNKDIDDFFIDLIYRLYSESEFNALTASVYGDLSAIKSKRKNINDDILKTRAYEKYVEFRDNFNSKFRSLRDYDDGNSLRRYLTSKKIKIACGSTEVSFLDSFKKRTIFLIKRLFKKIMFVADKYYMDDEFEYPKSLKIEM